MTIIEVNLGDVDEIMVLGVFHGSQDREQSCEGAAPPGSSRAQADIMSAIPLIARRTFVSHMVAIEQTIRGLLKVYGLKLGQVHRCTFAAKVQLLLENKPDLRVAIEPLLEARNVMRRQHVVLDRHLSQIARKDEVRGMPSRARSGHVDRIGSRRR